jgi:hypothetical protein
MASANKKSGGLDTSGVALAKSNNPTMIAMGTDVRGLWRKSRVIKLLIELLKSVGGIDVPAAS